MPGKSRDLNYRLTADPRPLQRGMDIGAKGMKSAEKSAQVLERELAKLEAQQRKVDQAMGEVGQGVFVAGAAIAAGLALSTKAAIDWESAWAGVTKTVDGSPQQMAALETELRGLARVLPATHTEIAAVAEAAGQLGIRRAAISDFTKTMIDLGVTTNLTAADAATQLARMSTIMGTAAADVSRLGATIVDLGNNSATTEAEILEMALRISGAGKTIGLTEADVLAFAAALSSVGVRAEAGGSAISRAFVMIAEAVRSGGDQLATFARVAGVSSDQFVAAYQQDAAKAIDMFIAGLGRMQAGGDDVFATLTELGMTEIRLRDAVLRLAGAGDVLTDSLRLGNRAWDENTALLEEANKRYGTTQAQLQITRNKIVDVAITLGQTFLPLVNTAADATGVLADAVGSLPGPLITVAGFLGLTAAALALTGGAAMMAVPRIAAYKAALDTLELSGGKAAGRVAGVARFLTGPWGLAVAGATAGLFLLTGVLGKSSAQVKEFADTLDDATGALTENTRALAVRKLQEQGALEDARTLGLSLSLVTDAALGQADALAAVNARLDQSRGAIVGFSSESRVVQGAGADLRRTLTGLSGDIEASTEKWRMENEAIRGTTDATQALPPEQRRLADTLGLTAEQAQLAAGEIDQLDKELKALFDSTFSLTEAEDALAGAFDKLREQVKRARAEGDAHATSLTGQTEAARANRDAARDLVRKSLELLETQAKLNPSTQALTELTAQLREQLIGQLVDMGFARSEAEEYAGVLDSVPSLIPTTITTPGMSAAQRDAERLRVEMDDLRGDYDVSIRARDHASTIIDRIHHRLRGLPGNVRIAIEGRGGHIEGFADGGRITGPGGPREDRVLIAASPGEFLVNAQAATANLPLLEAINAGMPATAIAPAPPSAAAHMSAGGPGGAPTTIVLRAGDRAVQALLDMLDFRIESVVDGEATLAAGGPR